MIVGSNIYRVRAERNIQNKTPIDTESLDVPLENSPDLFPALNETLLKVWATKKANEHGGIELIRLYISPKAGQRYYIYFKAEKSYKTKFFRDLFTNFLRKKAFFYSLKDVYRSNLPLHWQDEWMLDTKLADKLDKNVYWTLYKKLVSIHGVKR